MPNTSNDNNNHDNNNNMSHVNGNGNGHDYSRRNSVLKSVSSTLSEMRTFFSNVFQSSSERVYIDDDDDDTDKSSKHHNIQVARTFTNSEFSMSHRYPSGISFSSRAPSLKILKSKHQSEARLLSTKMSSLN